MKFQEYKQKVYNSLIRDLGIEDKEEIDLFMNSQKFVDIYKTGWPTETAKAIIAFSIRKNWSDFTV